jgi:autophagy-related protein 101
VGKKFSSRFHTYISIRIYPSGVHTTDILPALLHTIFFHRLFPPLAPLTRDLLDLTLPAIDDVDLETLIDQRATALVRAVETGSATTHRSGRSQVCVQFFEKKRRKTYFSFKEDDVCWEQWTLDVTIAMPRTESGTYTYPLLHFL